MTTTERTIAELQRILDATPSGVAVCPPLQRALLARIAAELQEKQDVERLLADNERLLAELRSRVERSDRQGAPPKAQRRRIHVG